MQRYTAKNQRRSLWGWIKWVPVLAIPFSILFFHAWLNIQILRADYVLRELNAEARDLSEQLSDTGIAETIHEDPEVLAARATLLDFKKPEPGQREIIRGSLPESLEGNGFAVASSGAAPLREPAVDEARSARSVPDEAAAPPAAPTPPLAMEVPYQPDTVTPVVLEIAPSLESIAAPAAPEAAPERSQTAAPPVVLELPDDAFLEDPQNLMDAGMGSLESL